VSNIINNVDLEKVAETTESGKKEKLTLRKPVKLHGEWNLDLSKGYQFRTELSYEKGKQVVEIDSPSFLGGNVMETDLDPWHIALQELHLVL
jgi:hypothetical protein